jgi:hypothetical protein
MLMVVAHEVFGHGARFRELGEGSLRYGFDVPIPYGPGGAFTRFNGSFPNSPLANMNASAAGIEAQHSLADAISERAVDRGRLHYREAWLYFESRMTAVSYIQSASADIRGRPRPVGLSARIPRGMHRTVRACDARRGSTPIAARPRRSAACTTHSTGLTVSYIGNGSTTGPMPLIPVGGGVRIMPSLGYTLVPYGTEWTLRTAFQQELRAKSRERRITHVAAYRRYRRVFDVGHRCPRGRRVRVRGLSIDLSVEAWRQPELLADKTSDAQHTVQARWAPRLADAARVAIAMVGGNSHLRRLQIAGLRAGGAALGRRSPPRGDYNVGAMSDPVLELRNASVIKAMRQSFTD